MARLTAVALACLCATAGADTITIDGKVCTVERFVLDLSDCSVTPTTPPTPPTPPPPPPPTGDPGTGLWMPGPGHYVVDQSTYGGYQGGITYVPGCVNGGDISGSDCEHKTSSRASLNGQSVLVTANAGEITSVRYKPLSSEGIGSITIGGQTGGAIGRPATITLSPTPGARNVPTFCKMHTDGQKAAILVAENRCPISVSHPIYYLNIFHEAACEPSNCIYKVSNAARRLLR